MESVDGTSAEGIVSYVQNKHGKIDCTNEKWMMHL